jgi:hypothetical protein
MEEAVTVADVEEAAAAGGSEVGAAAGEDGEVPPLVRLEMVAPPRLVRAGSGEGEDPSWVGERTEESCGGGSRACGERTHDRAWQSPRESRSRT